MTLPCGNCNGVGHSNSTHRHPTNSRRAVAKLPIIIKTPAPNRPVGFQGNCMSTARRNRHHVVNRPRPHGNRATRHE